MRLSRSSKIGGLEEKCAFFEDTMVVVGLAYMIEGAPIEKGLAYMMEGAPTTEGLASMIEGVVEGISYVI